MSSDRKDISNFYDAYTKHQKKIGVNLRHRTILRKLKENGLKPGMSVLEIGCGIGTVTGLVGAYVNPGKVVAVDISPESIEIAKKTYSAKTNLEFMVSDMSDFSYDHKFDFVLLPDVLEHIPVEQHLNLFSVLRKHMHIDSVICINIPAPRFLAYCHKYTPEVLQIIDQPLNTSELLQKVYANDLYIEHLQTYSLQYVDGDYQWIVLRPNKELTKPVRRTKSKLVIEEIKSRLY